MKNDVKNEVISDGFFDRELDQLEQDTDWDDYDEPKPPPVEDKRYAQWRWDRRFWDEVKVLAKPTAILVVVGTIILITKPKIVKEMVVDIVKYYLSDHRDE